MSDVSEQRLADALATCVGAIRGVALGMEKQAEMPLTVRLLRQIADDAWRAVVKATELSS